MEQLRRWAVTKPSPLYEWSFTAAAIILSVGLRYYLDPALPPGFPFLTFFPAVILTGYFASTRAGVIVAACCGIAAWYFFVAPTYSFALTGPTVLTLAFYFFIVTTDLVLLHTMRMALSKLEAEKQRSMTLAAANKTMFHELQHRVANNLQVVASLLKMQRRNVTDDSARAALDAASARLQVVSNIQRQLHNPKRQSTDIGQVLRDVLPEVVNSSALSDRTELVFDVEPLIVSGDQATPVALIVVELVSNAVEHATRGDGRTRLHLQTRSRGSEGTIVVEDDGKGLPLDFHPEKSRSLGLRVALQFAEQLHGALSFESLGPGDHPGGTRVTFRFPLDGHTG